MTDVQKFLNRYPEFPLPIAEKFSSMLALTDIESQAYVNAKAFYLETLSKGASLQVPAVLFPWEHVFSLAMFRPSDERFKRVVNVPFGYKEIPSNIAGKADPAPFSMDWYESQGLYYNPWYPVEAYLHSKFRFRPSANITYDSRLYASVNAKFGYEFTPRGNVVQILVSDIIGSTYIPGAYGSTKVTITATGAPQNFAGLSSIIALLENGIVIDGFDLSSAKEFYTYLQAYQKYSQQIESSATNAKARASDEFKQYEQGLISELRQEQSQLENLAISTGQQMQSEAATIQRDIVSLTLQAQMLANQLQGQLKL